MICNALIVTLLLTLDPLELLYYSNAVRDFYHTNLKTKKMHIFVIFFLDELIEIEIGNASPV